jgi:hypothetical protein
MRQIYSVNEILSAVSEISLEKKKSKKFSKNKRLEGNRNKSLQPLLLTDIIKYEPKNKKLLFLKKLYNTNIKIIAMKVPGINK